MFVLVVDSTQCFGYKYRDFIIQYAISSVEALKFLEDNFGLIAEIWLNYNLSRSDTVMPVVKWLEEKAYNGEANHITAIRILTSNPVEYNRITLALNRYFFIGLAIKPKSIRGEIIDNGAE